MSASAVENVGEPASVHAPSLAERLSHVELSGSLPCFVCGYDLKGISIVGHCPECGTAVRATVLFRVDPTAEAFRPVHLPRVMAWSSRVWLTGAVVAVLAVWSARLRELAAGPRAGALAWESLTSDVAIWSMAASGVAALLMLRPIARMAWWKTASAVVGSVVGYGLLIWGYVLVLVADDGRLAPYSLLREAHDERLYARLLMGVGALVVIVGCRPVARELVKRSVTLRTRRVDRQTLLAISAAVAAGMVGDGLRLWATALGGTPHVVLDVIGTVVVAVSSVLVTVGLLAALVDAWRIARALEVPAPSLESVLSATGSRAGVESRARSAPTK